MHRPYAKGQSAGTGLVFDNSLSLDMSTGAANISQINGRTERMTVTSDGKQMFSFPVSLGKASTPTFSGVKVVMEKDKVQRMTGPGYDLDRMQRSFLVSRSETIYGGSDQIQHSIMAERILGLPR